MSRRSSVEFRLVAVLVCLLLAGVCWLPGAPLTGFKGVLVPPGEVTREFLRSARAAGTNSIVLELSDTNAASAKQTAQQVAQSGFELYYWIEIGRSPALADAHPRWMASIQTHPEWRRFYPTLPTLKPGEVVKTYPWVPVWYEESFAAHLERVKALLKPVPAARGIFLNDLQAAPSACGCGHHLCRWTPDYGPLRTAKQLGDSAAADFVAAVREVAPGSRIIPVWVTECEEHDAKELCAGVGCFKGACWREWTTQLRQVATQAETLGALVPYRALQRDLARYGSEAGWIKAAVASFNTMPARYDQPGVAANRIVTVLQGWDVTPEQVQAQIARSLESGAAGFLVPRVRIEQGWEPRILHTNQTAALERR